MLPQRAVWLTLNRLGNSSSHQQAGRFVSLSNVMIVNYQDNFKHTKVLSQEMTRN